MFAPFCSEACRANVLEPADARFQEMKTAKAWHKSPSEWAALSEWDRSEMMAHDMIDGTREAFTAERQLEQMEQKKKPEQPENAYQRQRRMWLGK